MDIEKEPTLIDKAASLTKAAYEWTVKDKFSKVQPEVFEQRKSICLACPHWDQEGFNGMGKCKFCGCSVVKLYMPSSRCPLNPPKWDHVVINHSGK